MQRCNTDTAGALSAHMAGKAANAALIGKSFNISVVFEPEKTTPLLKVHTGQKLPPGVGAQGCLGALAIGGIPQRGASKSYAGLGCLQIGSSICYKDCYNVATNQPKYESSSEPFTSLSC